MARKLLLLGAAAIAAGVFLKRDKVAGLLPGRGHQVINDAEHAPVRAALFPEVAAETETAAA